MKDKTQDEGKQVWRTMAQRPGEFVGTLVEELDKALDKRLVRTFDKALQTIVTFRHGSHGSLLNELGG